MELIYHDAFVASLFKHSESGNTLFSPESFSSLFTSTFEAFDATTQSSLVEIFRCREENFSKSLNLYDHKLWKQTKVFIRKEVNLPKAIKSNFKNKFGCCVEEVDVKESDCLSSIKHWITNNIRELNCDKFVKPSINNVLNCNFKWHHKVQVNTSNQTFYQDHGPIDTEFIGINGELGYTESVYLDAKIVEIPLANEDLKTILIVPNNKDGLNMLEKRLQGYHLQQLLRKLKQSQIKISIPKIKVKQELNLKDLFCKLNYSNPWKFGGTNLCHMGAVNTFTSMEISETDVKAVTITGGELLLDPVVKEIIFETNINNRFAKTLITTKMENLEDVTQETTFSVIVSENAYITEFVMEIKGKSYKSYVKEKEGAKDVYDEAVAGEKSASHATVSARDSNKFTVSVNVEPQTEIKFLLTYEELLRRRYDQYELVLNIHSDKFVDVLQFLVKIDESKKLKFIKTPAIRSGNEITVNEEQNSLSKIEISNTSGLVRFEPNVANQKEIVRKLGFEETKGISCQFIVQYDVELDPSNGEILFNDGYFVYFHAPDYLPPLPKHVIFALDTSSSMKGRKIDQLKDAMKCILDQIRTNDLVDILEFNTNVSVHDINSQVITVIKYKHKENYHKPFYKYERIVLPTAGLANGDTIEKAKVAVDRMDASILSTATDSTHMIGALETALFLVKRGQKEYSNYQPIIIFLTDGMATAGITPIDEITRIVTKLNHENNKTPIFSLCFGGVANEIFLKRFSLANFGFSRRIYEASDASLQVQQFYEQISSPLLSKINFKYHSNVEDITRSIFPVYFGGSDIIICGKYLETDVPDRITLCHQEGCIQLKPIVTESVTKVERLWAYLTVKQLLEQREYAEDKTVLTKKVLELALKYSFVTEVTSLVVVKSDDNSVIETASIINTDYFNVLDDRTMAYAFDGPLQFQSLPDRRRRFFWSMRWMLGITCICGGLCNNFMKKTDRTSTSDHREKLMKLPTQIIPSEITVGVCFWPIFQTINYTYVSVKNRVPLTGLASTMWCCFLAYMHEKQMKDKLVGIGRAPDVIEN